LNFKKIARIFKILRTGAERLVVRYGRGGWNCDLYLEANWMVSGDNEF